MKKIILILSVTLFTSLACNKLDISDRRLKFEKEGGCQEVVVKARLSPFQGAELTCTDEYFVGEKYIPGGGIVEVWGGPDTCIYKCQWLEVHQYFDKPLKVFVEENKTGEKRELRFAVTSGNIRNFIKVTQKGK